MASDVNKYCGIGLRFFVATFEMRQHCHLLSVAINLNKNLMIGRVI